MTPVNQLFTSKYIAKLLAAGCYWDSTDADNIRAFIQTYCYLPNKYPPYDDRPIKLLAWQWKILRNLYSWHNKDGSKLFNQLLLYVPKKSGKSLLIALLALATASRIPNSSTICLGSTKEEASIVFNDCANLSQRNQTLAKRFNPRYSKEVIEHTNGSKIKMLSGNPKGKAGGRHQLVIYDELAAWRNSSARIILDQLENSGRGTPNHLKVVITTAQYETEGNKGYEKYLYAKSILAGVKEDLACYPVIYEVSEAEDWTDINNVVKANPSAGLTYPVKELAEDLRKSKESPLEEGRFRTLVCNQWVGLSEYLESHIVVAATVRTTEQELEDNQGATLGIDMSKRFDLTSYNIFVKSGDYRYAIPRIFIPKSLAYKKALIDNVPYDAWANGGYITLTPGDVIDTDYICDRIVEDCKRFKVTKITYDAYGMETARRKLEDATQLPVIEVPQTYPVIAPATSLLEKQIREGKIKLLDNPCLRWCFSNIKLQRDGMDRIKIDKVRSRARVDAVTSLIIALAGWEEEQVGDFYFAVF